MKISQQAMIVKKTITTYIVQQLKLLISVIKIDITPIDKPSAPAYASLLKSAGLPSMSIAWAPPKD